MLVGVADASKRAELGVGGVGMCEMVMCTQCALAALGSQTTRVDILVNNAGVGAVGTVLDATADEWEKSLA